MQGETLQVQRLAFQTGGSGSVTVSGSLRFDGPKGWDSISPSPAAGRCWSADPISSPPCRAT